MRALILMVMTGLLLSGCAGLGPSGNFESTILTPMDAIRGAAGVWESKRDTGHNFYHSVVNTGLAFVILPVYVALYPGFLGLEALDQHHEWCKIHGCSTGGGGYVYDERGNAIGEIY